jgi:hypothetical protein
MPAAMHASNRLRPRWRRGRFADSQQKCERRVPASPLWRHNGPPFPWPLGSPALDAGLLAAAQAVEHYEISRYGTLRAWAEELGLNQAVELLQETLQEEEATDEALTEIAKSAINQRAEAA